MLYLSRSRIRFQIVITVIGVAVLGACQSTPDVSSWTQSTKDITAAVTEAFQTAARINSEIAARVEPAVSGNPKFEDPAKRYAAVAKALSQRAQDYETLFGALADYAASLAAIADASATSQQTVDGIAGSLNDLVGSFGGTALAGPAFDLMKGMGNEVIKIKAASDFSNAVEQADPVIGQVTDLLLTDLSDLANTVAPSKDAVLLTALEEPHEAAFAYYSALQQRRDALQAGIRSVIRPPADPGAAVTTGSILSANDAPELAKVEQYLATAEIWHAPLQAEIDAALAARASAEELVVQTRRAVAAWRSSHASIASAVRERRLPDSGRLVALATRVRDLVSEMKQEQNKEKQ